MAKGYLQKIWIAAFYATICAIGAAHAAQITVSVRDEQSEAIDDAVVILTPRGALSGAEKNRARSEAATSYQIVQKDLKFSPHVLAVPLGATVTFPNQDTVRHHVYSFSPARKFELALYGRDEDRSVTFENAGIVAIGCNIHDDMQAFIYVYDKQQRALVSERGGIAFENIPEGEYSITVWHPRLKRLNETLEQIVRVDENVSYDATMIVPLRPAHRPARAMYN